MKKVSIVLGACLVVAALLSGCNESGGAKAGGKDTLVVISSAAPASLDPAMSNDTASAEIAGQVYSTLFRQDFRTLEPIPELVESYGFETDVSGNSTILRLFLKKGVKFHNGEEFKASDVKFTIDRAVVSPHIGHISGSIQSAEVIDDYEVLLHLKYPFAPILNNLAHTAMSIVNEKAVTEGGSSYGRNPVGTGPMKFSNWVEGVRIELTRWDGYYGEAPRIKNITIRYIADPQTALLELETGGADILVNLMPQDIAGVERNHNLKLLRAMDLRLNYLGFNLQKTPLDDVRVRQAIIHAINTEQLVQNVYQGVGAPGRAPIASKVWASAAGQLEPYEYNPAKARQLLAEAGYPNGFSTTISTNDPANLRDTAVIIQGMLREVGIKVDINILEWATYLEMTANGDADMFLLGWTTVTGDPDYGLEIFHSRAHGPAGNRSFYTNEEVDRLLDAGRMELDPAIREQMYFDAQRLIHADAPIMYTQEGEVTVGVRANVQGFTINPARTHPFYNVWFE